MGAVFGGALLVALAAATVSGVWSTASKHVRGSQSPLLVTVVRDSDAFRNAWAVEPEFIFARPIAKIGPPPTENAAEGRWKWARERGGIDGHESTIRVVVQGRTEAQVTLQKLDVEVLERRPPLKGTAVSYTGLGGGADVRHVDINLDRQPPRTNGFGKGAPEALRVSASDAEVFNLRARTYKCDCLWIAKLSYIGPDGKDGRVTIDDHGKPFRTSSTGRSRVYAWAYWTRPPHWILRG